MVVYHSLLGDPRLIELETQEDLRVFLDLLSSGKTDIEDDQLRPFFEVSDGSARSQLSERKSKYVQHLKEHINFLSLLTSEACNLGCAYCIAGENMRYAASRKAAVMTWKVAERAIDWYFSILRPGREGYVNFSGGEPLLNWHVVFKSLEYIDSKYSPLDRLKFSINTNATLIDESIAKALKYYRVDVATSLDGTPVSSDLVRIGKATGFGVSHQILKGWRILADIGHPISGYMATFNDRNITALDETVVEFAAGLGCSWVRVDCDVIHLLAYPVDELIDRIWRIYLRGKQLGVAVEGFWSSAAHNLLSHKPHREAAFFCGAVSGETVSVHPDGRLSACGFSSGRHGYVTDEKLLDWRMHEQLVSSYFPGERAFCKGCSIEGSCAGGCNIAREESFRSGTNAAIEYNCTIYRELTARLLKDYFLDLADGRHRCQLSAVHTH